MNKITNIDEYKPHEIAEVMCLHCMNRWISVHEQGEWLAKWECPKCVKVGGIIYIYIYRTTSTIIIFFFCPEY